MRKQLAAFHQRGAFRQGHFRQLFKEPVSEGFDQAQYFRLWASHLPFVKTKMKEREAALQDFVLAEQFHAKGYRLRTLRGDSTAPALPEPPPSTLQQADRLYLWTWNWLRDPSDRNRANLTHVLEAFDFKGALRKMTFEDFQMLRSALGWIALFQEALAPSLNRYLENFTIHDCEPFPIFAYERLWIDLLTAAKAKRPTSETEKKIAQHELDSSTELRLREFAENWLREFNEKERKPKRADSILVNEETGEIQSRKTKLVSRPLAQLFAHLERSGTLSFTEALWLGFEIAPYDQGIHAPKIYNLLARAKELLPKSVRLTSKDNTIYCEAPTDFVYIKPVLPQERRIWQDVVDILQLNREVSAAKTKRAFERPIHPRMLLEKTGGRRTLSRKELQEAMSLSKTTVTRWLEKWQQQGLIRREGSGPSSRYIIEIA